MQLQLTYYFFFLATKMKTSNNFPVKILMASTSLPPRGSTSRIVSVTFDYSLEGKEQMYNDLISNRWLRSSKMLFCPGASSSAQPGMQNDQRPPEHSDSAAPILTDLQLITRQLLTAYALTLTGVILLLPRWHILPADQQKSLLFGIKCPWCQKKNVLS